jgi:ATP-dependent DNA helicase RecG
MKEKEHQSIEWKESWQDEYLKWICGYANAYGGTIYIGTNDDGNVVGIDNAKDLLEIIPNKITDTMGIIVDVNLMYKGELEYLQIVVDKYPSLISFRGKYYYRSGSTMREITGKELERKLLKTQGRTWDGVPIPKLSVTDLKQDAIQLFKDKAVKRGRLTKEEVSVPDDILLDNLHLIDEDGYLVRAAMLAFYKDPEKWVTGSYIKIGFFGKSDSDLLYQDEIHGPLIEQVDKTVDLVYTKYLKALIAYEGIQRVEQFMFHKDAFREILLNAIVHKDYSSCNPIQISVYEDKIYIWNDGEMPEELDSTDKLFLKHASKPYNPKLANVFFKSGMIEAWGRGFEKIKEACALYEGPLPEYEISASGIMVLCKACDKYLELLSGNKNIDSVIADERIMSEKVSELKKEPIVKIVNYLKENEEITTAKGVEITGKSEAQVRRYLKVLCNLGIIKSTRTTKGNVYVRI